MKTGRKTTQEERISIAKECLENECNYEETARKHTKRWSAGTKKPSAGVMSWRIGSTRS